ncbi:MAG: 1-acyl-sn-glycerol-3-phosphate acyltransferase [Pirellulaceae bacterium]|nr:1-acyl-sn-glycerol-3-phosphate acyltransferase [Pirellulaceae bacterium]
MSSVVIDEPYEFVPPYRSSLWARGISWLMPWDLRKSYGITSLKCEGLEHLRASIKAGHGVLLAPNHCRPADPLVANLVCHRAKKAPHTMASWHLFKQSRLQSFFLRRIGAFSVYREGLDRLALQAGVQILTEAKRPLIIFPEGVITKTNDRMLSLMDGVSFVTRGAAKKRAALNPPGQVVVHPLAIRYYFHGDIDEALHTTLDDVERKLSWRPKQDPDLVERIYRVGEALLWLKEIEYLGQPQFGAIPARLQKLIDTILVPLEKEWIEGVREGSLIGRIKRLRFVILREMIQDQVTEEERDRRWKQLDDMNLAQQLGHYAPDYVKNNPTPERLLETVEKFEFDLTGSTRIHRPMSAKVRIGPAIPVPTKRDRETKHDSVMLAVEQQLHELLGITPLESTPEIPSAEG